MDICITIYFGKELTDAEIGSVNGLIEEAGPVKYDPHWCRDHTVNKDIDKCPENSMVYFSFEDHELTHVQKFTNQISGLFPKATISVSEE